MVSSKPYFLELDPNLLIRKPPVRKVRRIELFAPGNPVKREVGLDVLGTESDCSIFRTVDDVAQLLISSILHHSAYVLAAWIAEHRDVAMQFRLKKFLLLFCFWRPRS
jgi:hypothetical protein